ncbi:MAG: hypothetical protein QM775_21135 [Pirellulales bacterium]
MSENRRNFVRRGLKALLAAAVVGVVVGKSNTAEAARCGSCRRPRRRRCC